MIRSKRDVERFLELFNRFSDVDEHGKRYVIVSNQCGTYTLMRRQDGQFTVHGRGDGWCDPAEVELSAAQAKEFVWKYRKFVNEWIRTRQQVEVSK